MSQESIRKLREMLSRYARPSVLVIEDDPMDAELVQYQFTNISADLVFAKNGEEAIKAASARDFALMIVDLILPDVVDPTEFVKQLKAIRPETPIVILTGAVTETLKRVLSKWALAVLVKPLTREQVEDAFKTLAK